MTNTVEEFKAAMLKLQELGYEFTCEEYLINGFSINEQDKTIEFSGKA